MNKCLLLNILGALLVALSAAVGQAPPAPEARSCFDDTLRLRLAAGWQVQPDGDDAFSLTAPEGQTVALSSWPMPPRGQASARAAAAAHESVLFERMPYRRLSAAPVVVNGGPEGLLVTGLAAPEDGRSVRVTFVAVAAGGRYFVFEMTGPEDAPAAEPTLREALGQAEFVAPPPVPGGAPGAQAPPAGNGGEAQPVTVGPPAPAVGPAPAPGPTADGGPGGDRPAPGTASGLPTTPPTAPAPTHPTPQPEPPKPVPAPEPVGPATPPTPPAQPKPPAPPAFIHHKSPLGYELDCPADWTVALVEGRLEVAAPRTAEGKAPALAIIWPLAQLGEDADPAALGRALLGQLAIVGARAADLKARRSENSAVLAGEVGPAATPVRLVACCTLQRDQGLLTALLAQPKDFEERLPALLRVLNSFSGGPWWADADDAGMAPTVWQAPGDSGLRLPVPADWRVTGEVVRHGELWSLQLELASPDQRLRCLWRQPVQPLFRDLTPVLRNLGWQEGDRYPANVKDNPLRLLTRLTPEEFLRRVWLQEGTGRLAEAVVDEVSAAPKAAALTGGENAAGIAATLHGRSAAGERQALCLVATGDVAPGGEPNCWQAAVLAAEGPPGAATEAASVLRTAIEGATVSAAALPGPAEQVREMVLAARQAAKAFPVAGAAAGRHVDVLAIRNDQARGRLWLQPLAALTLWQQAHQALARGEAPTAAAPELSADYWK